MIRLFAHALPAVVFLSVLLAILPDSRGAGPLFELRVYRPNEGKQTQVVELIRKSGLAYMAKHKIQLLGAWIPSDSKDARVITLVAHSDRAAADKAWADFQADPGWKADLEADSKNGRAVAGIDRFYLDRTDYSPELLSQKIGERIFELRTYFTSNNLSGINARFRDHTMALFTKHGMNNLVYWNLNASDATPCEAAAMALSPSGSPTPEIAGSTPAKDVCLVYFLTHKNEDAMKASFNAFREDPIWIAARDASEKKAGGSLTVPQGVKSWILKPLDYSPIQ